MGLEDTSNHFDHDKTALPEMQNPWRGMLALPDGVPEEKVLRILGQIREEESPPTTTRDMVVETITSLMDSSELR